MNESVPISVLVTIVDGGRSLRDCLRALSAQKGASPFEVIVPWDSSLDVADLELEFPTYRFPAMGHVETTREPNSPAGQHELFDRRRAVGLAAAEGQLVCILEDRGLPAPDWLAHLERLHHEHDAVAIGGAVECGVDAALNWAVFFCDFGRYQPPFDPGPREYVTDVNIAYTRKALEATRDLWIERYHETTVNWALARDGGTLLLSPLPVVHQVRHDLDLAGLVRERLDWGRLFAYTRAREATLSQRMIWLISAPVLPVVLLLRHGLMQWRKKRHFGRFLSVSPLVLLLVASWSLGEFRGYLTSRP